MKKIALLTLFICWSIAGFSQVKLGLRVAPNISFNRTVSEGIFNNIENNGASIRFSAGPFADFFFADNYAFHTGLWYTVKRSAIRGNIATNGTTVPATSLYNLQYLQIPAAIKLYTNEVAPDLRIYFLLGGTFDIKIAEKQKNELNNFLYNARDDDKRAYKPIDAGILLGAGLELLMGETTIFYGGINYNRGLINTLGGIEYNGTKINNDLKLGNSYSSLEIGIKF
jgi:hypothetical protein